MKWPWRSGRDDARADDDDESGAGASAKPIAPPAAGAVDVEMVKRALRSNVMDPEVGMNIVDLGLVYGIEAGEGCVVIRMTMTSPACPLGEAIERDVREVAGAVVPEGTRIDVELVWDPPWNPTRMSEEARKRFGWKPA